MIIPFFLTRQTANLMEDFAREVKDGPALFLLYGENGVGKTRLLQELCQSRFGERRIHWLDLGSGDSADGTRLDYSHGIEELFDKAENGDIVIADHFEEALKKTRHQLFLSWSTDGIDKNLNMIIGSSNEGFNELRQLSQQYQVRVQSFQQMPFSADEVESFLGFCLFPDQPATKLKIPGPVRKQLAATQGNVGRLIDVIGHHGKQIRSPSAPDAQSIRQGSKIIVGVLLLFVVAIGAGWFFLQSPLVTEEERLAATPAQAELQARAPDPAPAASEEATGGAAESADEPAAAAMADPVLAGDAMVSEAEPEAAADAASETPAEDYAADEAAAPAETTTGEVTATEDEPSDAATGGESAVVAETGQADEIAPTPLVADANPPDGAATGAVAPAEDVIEAGTVPDSEAVIDDSVVDSETIDPVADTDSVDSADAAVDTEAADGADLSADSAAEEIAKADLPEADSAQPRSNWDRFARELKDSKDWIGQHEDAVGTIQILLLTFDTFDADVYYQYVANLARRNVDTDKLHVFKTLTGSKEVYSVFYGEYASRPAALRAIDELPEVLRDTSPIPRSVGGIRQEIRRLENKN